MTAIGQSAFTEQEPHETFVGSLLRLLSQTAEKAICLTSYDLRQNHISIHAPAPVSALQYKAIRRQLQKSCTAEGIATELLQAATVSLNGEICSRPPQARHKLPFKAYHTSYLEQYSVMVQAASYSLIWPDQLLERMQQIKANPLLLHQELIRAREDISAFHMDLLKCMLDGVIICDAHDRIWFINDKARKLAGIDSQPLRGDRIQATAICDVQSLLAEAREQGVEQANKLVRRKGNSASLLGIHIRHIASSKSKSDRWLIIIRDVTASWQTDHLRSTLTYVRAELALPLLNLKATVNNSKETLKPDVFDSLRVDLEQISYLAERLQTVNIEEQPEEMLDRRRTVALPYVMRRVLEMHSARAEATAIRFRIDLPDNLPAIKADRDHIHQILSNLIDNAIKFSFPGCDIHIRAERQDAFVKISISDDGIGIAREDQDRIFERYTQLDLPEPFNSSGFGIGLSVVKSLVEARGGEIRVDSKPGAGSTFSFTLPAQSAAEQTPDTVHAGGS